MFYAILCVVFELWDCFWPSATSMFSADSDMDIPDILERLKKEEGIYG
jgi:hypothetical protein